MSQSISFLGKMPIVGNIYNDEIKNQNISAIEVVGDRLIIGSDEGNKIKILKFNGEAYAVERGISLSDDREIDIEGIACEGSTVYIVGSHSYKRKKIDRDATYQENRQAIAQKFSKTDRQERDRLFRLDLNDERQIDRTSVRDFLDRSDILEPFSHIPSKENGIDIEGIAVRDRQLYIGFRAPVLRDNWVPVLKCEFAKEIGDRDLMFVDLNGRGFRDLTRVSDGFLILAGALGDAQMSQQIYFWNGEDCLPGSDRRAGKTQLLGEIPITNDGNAEGIAVVAESESHYEVLIAFDNEQNGAIGRYRIDR